MRGANARSRSAAVPSARAGFSGAHAGAVVAGPPQSAAGRLAPFRRVTLRLLPGGSSVSHVTIGPGRNWTFQVPAPAGRGEPGENAADVGGRGGGFRAHQIRSMKVEGAPDTRSCLPSRCRSIGPSCWPRPAAAVCCGWRAEQWCWPPWRSFPSRFTPSGSPADTFN